MADYPCIVIPIHKLTPTNDGFKRPLCDTCFCRTCDNPIQSKDVAMFGTKPMRLHVQGNQIGMVVQCDGYLP